MVRMEGEKVEAVTAKAAMDTATVKGEEAAHSMVMDETARVAR